MKKLFIVLALCITGASLLFTSCRDNDGEDTPVNRKSIVILYDNDVHGALDGYVTMAGLKDAMTAADTSEILTVSSGDFCGGSVVGKLSKGEQIINIMNAVGYDAVTVGNHEFDFGMQQLDKLVKMSTSDWVDANFTYGDTDENIYQPYIIKNVGGKKIALLGVTTPSVMTTLRSMMCDSVGNIKYDIHGEDMVSMVQKQVDAARNAGADHVVVLSHLGEDAKNAGSEWTSLVLIHNTTGIDVVLDGHTHDTYADSLIANKNGDMVHMTQTGTNFANIGKLWISKDGTQMNTSLIPTSDLTYTNARVKSIVDSTQNANAAFLSETIAKTDYELIANEQDEQKVTCRKETNLGDIVADAYAYCTDAQIAMELGESFCADIHAGDITNGDVMNTVVYNNTLTKHKITGAKIKQLLTTLTASVPEWNLRFPQVSGIKFTIDVTSGSPVLSDIQIVDQKTGSASPLDEKATYTIAINNYYADAYYDIFGECESLSYGTILLNNECLTKFLKESLNGTVSSVYTAPQGRITIVQ